MTITPEGDAFLVTATVQDTWQLKWWIRSQGPQAEVLEPVALREEFCESLKQTLRLYSPTV
jgi:predicted DNA-binding transcriptional regulator YafY